MRGDGQGGRSKSKGIRGEMNERTGEGEHTLSSATRADRSGSFDPPNSDPISYLPGWPGPGLGPEAASGLVAAGRVEGRLFFPREKEDAVAGGPALRLLQGPRDVVGRWQREAARSQSVSSLACQIAGECQIAAMRRPSWQRRSDAEAKSQRCGGPSWQRRRDESCGHHANPSPWACFRKSGNILERICPYSLRFIGPAATLGSRNSGGLQSARICRADSESEEEIGVCAGWGMGKWGRIEGVRGHRGWPQMGGRRCRQGTGRGDSMGEEGS